MDGITQVVYEQQFLLWYKPIRNFVYYKSGDAVLAEDIAQDTFLKIWEKKERIHVETFNHLAFKIAGNLYINRKSHQNVIFRFVNSFKKNNKDENNESPEFELEMKEFDGRLQKILAQMDEKKRTVFLMNRIDKFTYQEIANKLDLSVKAVEKRMSLALEYLRTKIDINL